MYLKRIDMQGFKSFAGKTKLEFHDGITGIVGPNGSGKSNVADAVRWVLGEQSARQLRGGNMQDVIFAGTENRRPLGYASVAITLDNSDRQLKVDAEELTVARRLYRSGESEYLLNGRNCRLKDIQELFYDTGIGKEGYSIIGQGQIDKILSGKPEDRRELFDEAAGIVKFKRRKTAALKKLEHEEGNLVRVTDILNEITSHLGPLESQAQKAETYLTKRDEMRQKDIQLYLAESGFIREQQEKLAESTGITEEQFRETSEVLSKTRLEYDQVEGELDTLDTKIGKNREDLQKAALLKQEYEGSVNLLEEQIHASETNAALFDSRMEQILQETDRWKLTKEEQITERNALRKAGEEAETKKAAAEDAVQRIRKQISEKTESAEQGREDTIKLLNKRTDLREQIRHYETLTEQAELRKSELSARLLTLQREKEDRENEEQSLADALSAAEKKAAEKQEAIEENTRTIELLRERINRNEERLEETRTAFHRDSSQLESLRNIAERYEGYGNSVKKVMEQKHSQTGILGVVADLFKTDKKYETAIETALGGSLQHVVTDNETTAKYLIEYLKRGRFGRVTFLPLNAVRPDGHALSGSLLEEKGVLGKAEDLVHTEERFKPVAIRLLAGTLVVDNVDHAISISRKYNRSVRIVTLDGELLNKGGAMTGGSYKYNSSLLGRKRQLKELEESVRKLQRDIGSIQSELNADKEKRGILREEGSALSDELQELLLEQNTARLNMEAGAEKTASIREECGRLRDENLRIDAQVDETGETLSLIREELQHSEEREEELARVIREQGEETEKLQKKEEEAVLRQDEARLSCSGILQQLAFVEERMKDAEAEILRLENEKTDLENSVKSESGSIEEKRSEIESTRLKIAGLEKTIEAGEQETEALLREKEELNQTHRVFFEKRDALMEQKSRLEQELFRLKTQEEKLSESMEQQRLYLEEEYQLTPEQAGHYSFTETPSRSKLKKEIGALKAEIRALGSVNVNAIEEYRELKERHELMSTQHKDIVEASEKLHGIIRELDASMRRQFREKFTLIQKEFDKVFRELFGGGKGTLELMEDENILEAGIQIISQPPGKKLQNMMQLSGGEKALTAIALLFAIQDLKPSPFCLLDEIEAALDDSNVGRFSTYLHKLTKNTQFIIITHRRGTMASADRLYGITMQEKGISAMVSVDLIESQLDA
ncbi:MAG: chromosome segregation protein SMC [Eubacterium sp.]|nr:chromosome segregation protein SMC [Eubacterium sp.]